jgi:hypothetical protein
MKKLIEALQILLKHGGDDRHPFHCEHDELHVWPGIGPSQVPMEDRRKLVDLGFSEKHECGMVIPDTSGFQKVEGFENLSGYEDPIHYEKGPDWDEKYSECGKYCGWHSFRYGSC